MREPYFQNDLVTLYHGDCLDVTEWLTADVLVTDPPYGMNRAFGLDNLDYVANDHSTQARDSALDLWGWDKPGIAFGHWKCERPKKIRHSCVWDKGRMAMGDQSSAFATSHEEFYVFGNTKNFLDKREQSVIKFNMPAGHARPDHPSAKPVGLMEHLIRKTGRGVVADPFAGSGSTLVAARNLGRVSIGIEMEERYCELIANRLSQEAFDFAGI